jgi:hypothetical protein
MNFYLNPDGPAKKSFKNIHHAYYHASYMITCARLTKAVNCSIVEEECITIFRGAMRIKYTLDPYELRLVAFLSGIGNTCDEFVELAKTNPAVAEKTIIGFILKEKQKAEHRSTVTTTCHGSLTAEILVLVYSRYCKVVLLLSNYLIQGPSYGCRVIVGKEVVEVLSRNELSS